MTTRTKKIIQFLYGPIFAVLDFFMRNYKANRERLEGITSREKISTWLQYVAIAVLVIWLAVWIITPKGEQNRLSDEVKSSIGAIQSKSE